MTRLFIDTGALLAMMLSGDRHHGDAVRFLRDQPHARFLLTNLVLAEVVTRLRVRADARTAAGAGRKLLDSARYEVLFADEPLIKGGLARIEQFQDKRLSLTDSVSFEVMDRFRLPAAFAFDRDFRDCGYRMVP